MICAPAAFLGCGRSFLSLSLGSPIGSTGGQIAGKRITIKSLKTPASERAPAIRSHRPVPLSPATFDEFLNPLRFEQSRFNEQVEKRAAHLHLDDEGHA
jgi:hypothetical protein